MTMTIDSIERRQGSGARETFTVRKQSFGVGVERSFPLHSPKIENLEVAVRGDVRRAKLHSLRERVGEAARVAVRRWGIDEEMVCPPLATATEGAAELAAEAGNETEAAADTDAEAPAAGETEDRAASEGAEDEEPAAAGDFDEDSAS